MIVLVNHTNLCDVQSDIGTPFRFLEFLTVHQCIRYTLVSICHDKKGHSSWSLIYMLKSNNTWSLIYMLKSNLLLCISILLLMQKSKINQRSKSMFCFIRILNMEVLQNYGKKGLRTNVLLSSVLCPSGILALKN